LDRSQSQADDAEERYTRLRQNVKLCEQEQKVFSAIGTPLVAFSVTYQPLPSGKHTKNYGKSPYWMGKSTISTGPFSMSQTVNITRGYVTLCVW
jgi:hypothetical protein